MNKDLITLNDENLHCEVLEACQREMIRAKILKKMPLFLLQELQ